MWVVVSWVESLWTMILKELNSLRSCRCEGMAYVPGAAELTPAPDKLDYRTLSYCPLSRSQLATNRDEQFLQARDVAHSAAKSRNRIKLREFLHHRTQHWFVDGRRKLKRSLCFSARVAVASHQVQHFRIHARRNLRTGRSRVLAAQNQGDLQLAQQLFNPAVAQCNQQRHQNWWQRKRKSAVTQLPSAQPVFHVPLLFGEPRSSQFAPVVRFALEGLCEHGLMSEIIADDPIVPGKLGPVRHLRKPGK